MGKEIVAKGLVGTSKKGLPLWHQIDFFGSMILLCNIYVLNLLFASASTNYVYLSIPNEFLLHGPIIQNISSPKPQAKPLICNPYFQLFRDQYLTNASTQLEKVKSEVFLAVPAVRTLLERVNSQRNRTRSTFSISANGICEMIPPANDWGDCMLLDEYKSQCLNGTCGTDPNFCFWDSIRIVNLCAYTLIFSYIAAVLLTFGLMFDPPPARLGFILRPTLCACSYLLSGVLAITGMMTCVVGVSRGISDVVYNTYTEFYVSYDAGWQCFLLASFASIAFSVCYFYIGYFTPKYPREPNRWELRRKNFERSLSNIKERVTQQA